MHGSLPRPGFTGPLRAHDPARHSLSGPARNHLPGHVPSSGSRTVLTLRLGIPDHGSPFDHFVARPLLSGGAQCPGPDSDGPDTTVTSPSRSGRAQRPARTRLGPDSSWPACHPSRPSATGYSGPERFSHPGSSHSQGQLLTCRSGTQQVQARSTWMPQRQGWLLFGAGVEVVLDNSLARPLLPRGSSTPAIHARAPRLGRAQRRWGGSTPNHPAALQTGMQMGFEPPEQHEQSTNQIVSWLAPNTTSRDTPEGGSSSSRGCERRSLRWLLNFRLDMVWDAETTRNLAWPPPDNQGAYRGLLQCPT